jgi:glyceraldehyde 3-phosphate dehydrogenase
MKTRVAINGFGRIGRGAFKVALSRGDIEIVAINDLAPAKTLANLLKHDSVYGAYDHPVTCDDNNLIVGNLPIKVLNQPDPASLPWANLNVQVVIEATGQFTDPAKARAHITAGAKKVIIAASAKGEGAPAVIIGANEDKLKEAGDCISTGGSTSACMAPVLDVLNQSFGVEKAMLTTVHSYTSGQKLVDSVAPDDREARAAAHNIVPSKNTSTVAVQVVPELNGKLDNLTIKVPTLAVSLADFTAVLKRNVTAQEVNEAFKKVATEPYYQGILTVTDEELVSSDFIGNSHSAIIDTKLTKVVAGNMVKIVAWYDNEWGFCNRLIELTADVGKSLSGEYVAPQQPAEQPVEPTPAVAPAPPVSSIPPVMPVSSMNYPSMLPVQPGSPQRIDIVNR